MKIGIDITTLMDDYYSGISEYSYRLIQELIEIDQDNEYILYYNSFSDKNNITINDRPNLKIVKTRYPNKIFNYGLQKILKFPEITSYLGEIDLFFSPHINFFSLKGDYKKVLTIHDLSFLRYKNFFSLRKNFWHQAINVKKLTKNYDKIIAVSNNTKFDLMDLCKVEENKISVVYSGIDNSLNKIDLKSDDHKEKIKELREKYKLPKKYIFYLGNLEPRKNIDNIIKAYDLMLKRNPSLSDYKLVLAGARGWKNKSIFKVWGKTVNKKNIFFLGYIDDCEKKYFYNMASIFVYPSFYEGFGFPPLEALCCGCPVVTSSNSSLGEVVGSYGLFADSHNYNDLSNGIENILLNIDYFQNITLKNIPNIKKKFLWKNSAIKYLRIFKDIVQK